MWEKFRIDKKLNIDRKYINIGIVVVMVGVALFFAYEIISRSGTYIIVAKNAIAVSYTHLPRREFLRFTTGITFKSYLETRRETSSWSTSG